MKTDVLILGGGLSARMAARVASDGGAKVTLVRDGGGASPFIHGICVPVHPDDSLDLFISDTLRSGKYQNDRALVETLCRGSLSLPDRYPFDRDENGNIALLRPLGASVPRVAGIKSETGLFLMREINGRGGFTELSHARALTLIRDGDRVVGAEVYDRESKTVKSIFAKAVILASGGFGNVFPFSTNSSDIGGDGIAMGFLSGCRLVDMEFIQFEPTAALSPAPLVGKSVITTMTYEGAVFKNGEGEPFLQNEKVDKDVLSKAIRREIVAGRGTERGGVYYDATAVPQDILSTKYASYVKRYADCGVDISKTPMEVAPAPHTTLGGVMIDPACKTDVPGLFACGEVTGGLHGANRLGGNAGLETVVFGEIAGRSALDYATHESEVADRDGTRPDEGPDVSDLHNEVRALAGRSLGVIRDGETMQKAIERLDEIRDRLASLPQGYRVTRASNDALTVSLALTAALARKGSVGAHERADAVDEAVRYSLIQSRNQPIRKKILS